MAQAKLCKRGYLPPPPPPHPPPPPPHTKKKKKKKKKKKQYFNNKKKKKKKTTKKKNFGFERKYTKKCGQLYLKEHTLLTRRMFFFISFSNS
jgi:hypothetical protein